MRQATMLRWCGWRDSRGLQVEQLCKLGRGSVIKTDPQSSLARFPKSQTAPFPHVRGEGFHRLSHGLCWNLRRTLGVCLGFGWRCYKLDRNWVVNVR
eukprot:4143581-Amphidinium_carterae.1